MTMLASQIAARLKATRAIVWTDRADLSAHGFDPEEAEAMLLTLAADLHRIRTGQRAGAVIVENGTGAAMRHLLERESLGAAPAYAEQLRALADGIVALHNDRGIC